MTPLAFFTLFLSAFGAATILPGSSEVVFSALLLEHPDALWLLLAVATIGNTLGSAFNWVLGRFLVHFQDRKWFPVSPRRLDQASNLFQRFGYPLLLLAWVPVIGDPLTVAAGVLRARFLPFLILVFIGKAGRYGVLASFVWAASAPS
ncbi:membrane protein YqaA with SNARE-associated domain [Dongia mobilis]|uniref:Membrane protein YqaA with SNARE-associated domain n=1 Tax=Dongia mobilis TaxID=578943 RepID=A0A4R6WYI7_9PROT|nr:YqaA family protein [Dongia mobilis]TDQ86371.1 membrane protein YqaA with SNARE-associated domain [Dongia mobilis]